MKLMIASYNNGGSVWNAEAEETAFLHYKITHRMNEPAEATIIIADGDGTKAQKYNADANDVYLGVGKVTIEDPTGTDIFYGRIMKAEADTNRRTVTLYCQDWLSQLDEEQITYDMRETLTGGATSSVICPDWDNSDGIGIKPAHHIAGVADYMYDHAHAWGFDTYNGMYVVLSDEMAGSIQVTTGPYTYVTDGGIDVFDNDIGDLWTDDTDKHNVGDAGGAWYCTYKFRVWTPESDFYSSCTGARIIMVSSQGTSDESIQLYNGATYDTIESMPGSPSRTVRWTVEIPESLIPTMFDANGEVWVKFNDATDGAHYMYYIMVQCDFETTGYSSTISITDGQDKRLTVGTDLTAAATKVWHGLPYSIAQKIYKHIDSAETPGDIITGGDVLVTLTCAATIEHTSGISTRRYIEMTRLQILKDLAIQDKAEFWAALGTATVTWKSTYNDGAPETLTDTDVNAWKSVFDYQTLVNKATFYGMRIGDRQLTGTYSDAVSIAKYIATRTKIESDSGIVSEYDATAKATALVNQYSGVQQILTATIRGNTATAAHPKTLVLGDEVSITSTYLGLAAAVYIVQRFEYDSETHLTTLLLHPRVSTTGLQREEYTGMEIAKQEARRGQKRYIPPPETS